MPVGEKAKCNCCDHLENDMEWFKHSTKEDPDVFDAIDQYGIGAYATWYMTLELYAEKYNDTDEDGFLVVSTGFLKRRLLFDSQQKETYISDILNFFSDRGRIVYEMRDGFHAIKVNNFEELASNWQRRKIREKGVPPESPLEGGLEAPPSRKKEEKEQKEKNEENIVSQVIDHLNEIGKFSYRSSSREAQKYIKGRAQEGAKLEDFKVVIEYKVKEWGQDPKMAQYLRPSTLFNSEKFWGYLNSAKMKVVTTRPTAGYRGSGVAI